jgi:hypothetical protein
MTQPKAYGRECFTQFGKDIEDVVRKTVFEDETDKARIGMHEGEHYGTPGFGVPGFVIPSSPFFEMKYYSGFGNSIEVRLFEKKRVLPFVHRQVPGKLYAAMYLNDWHGFVEISVFDEKLYEPVKKKILEDELKYSKWFESGVKILRRYRPASRTAAQKEDISTNASLISRQDIS